MKINLDTSIVREHRAIEEDMEEALRTWKATLRNDAFLEDTQNMILKISKLIGDYRHRVFRDAEYNKRQREG